MGKSKSDKPAGKTRRTAKIPTTVEVAQSPKVEVAPAAAFAPADLATYLQGSFDIHGVEGNYRELRGLLASGLPVLIDVSRLDAVDTCGVQLLLALEQEARRRSVPFTLRGQSAVFDNALHGLGLSDAFANARRHG